MHIDEVRLFCLNFPYTSESFPFGDDVLVFKVKGKIFALLNLSKGASVNLKCNPERAIELRDHYPLDVEPGYHMNKAHWNTVKLEGRLMDSQIKEFIEHSYQLVVKSLPKKEQVGLL